jgi:protein-L-isoaspartate O-methyltransferase
MSLEDRRIDMIEAHLEARGIRDRHVLRAMAIVPREAFIPADLAELAYEDSPATHRRGPNDFTPCIAPHMIPR